MDNNKNTNEDINNKLSELQKPFSVVIKDFRTDIVTTINNSELSPIIIEMIIKDIYMEIKTLSDNICNNESEMYKSKLKDDFHSKIDE